VWLAEPGQLEAAVAVGGAHHHDVDRDAFDRVAAVHPGALYRGLAYDGPVKNATASAWSLTTS
jgi:hypothetical protein